MGPAGPGPLVTLRRGRLELTLAPAAGGAVVTFRAATAAGPVELLRPSPPAAVALGDPWQLAAYPLVPWSNRIRDARFTFAGRPVTLGAAGGPGRHALHGLGVRAAWAVGEAGPDAVRLEHRPAPGAWPWDYRAEQRLALTPASLVVELGLVNQSAEAMPAGLGWHPYFPRTPRTTLTAAVTGMWTTDDEILPVARVVPAPGRDPTTGLAVDQVALDNVFVGWGGQAVIAWPERDARMTLAAPPPLDCLVVYTPPDQAFFCAEPVSHVTDAFNLAAAGHPDSGLRALAPGQALRATITLTPELP